MTEWTYQSCSESHGVSSSNVSYVIIKEELKLQETISECLLGSKKLGFFLQMNYKVERQFDYKRTVRRGSTSAKSTAMFMASMAGFSTTGNSSGRDDRDRLGFMVSKQIISSKQSLIPILSNTFIAWTLSEFVNIYGFFFSTINH